MEDALAYLRDFRTTRDFATAIPQLLNDEPLRNAVFAQIANPEYPYPEYSSWLAIHFLEKNPQLFTEELCAFMIAELLKTQNHSMQRNICTILWHYKGDLSENTALLDLFFHFLTHSDTLPALRIHALKNIEIHYLKPYPELMTEILSAFELLDEYPQPSIRSMIRNFRKKHKIQSP